MFVYFQKCGASNAVIKSIYCFCFFSLKRTDVWGEDANDFKPDRFLPENSELRHPYSFLPFGGGARNCIGKYTEIKSNQSIQ